MKPIRSSVDFISTVDLNSSRKPLLPVRTPSAHDKRRVGRPNASEENLTCSHGSFTLGALQQRTLARIGRSTHPMELRDRNVVGTLLKTSSEVSSWRSLSKNEQRGAVKKGKRKGLSQMEDTSPSGPAGPDYPSQANARYMKRKPSSSNKMEQNVWREVEKGVGEEVGGAINEDALLWIAQCNTQRPESRRPSTCFNLNCSDKERGGDRMRDKLHPRLWSEFAHLPLEDEPVHAAAEPVKTRPQSRTLRLMESTERRNVRGPISRQTSCYPHPEHGPVDAGIRDMNGSSSWIPTMLCVQEIAV